MVESLNEGQKKMVNGLGRISEYSENVREAKVVLINGGKSREGTNSNK